MVSTCSGKPIGSAPRRSENWVGWGGGRAGGLLNTHTPLYVAPVLQGTLGPAAPHLVPIDAGAPLELLPAVRARELHALVHGVDVVHQWGPALEHLAAVVAVVAVAAGDAAAAAAATAAAHDHDSAATAAAAASSRHPRLGLGGGAPARLARASGLAAHPHVSGQEGGVHEGQVAHGARRGAGDGGHGLLAAARSLVLGQHGGLGEHQLADLAHVGHRALLPFALGAVALAAQVLVPQEVLVVPEEDLAVLAGHGPAPSRLAGRLRGPGAVRGPGPAPGQLQERLGDHVHPCAVGHAGRVTSWAEAGRGRRGRRRGGVRVVAAPHAELFSACRASFLSVHQPHVHDQQLVVPELRAAHHATDVRSSPLLRQLMQGRARCWHCGWTVGIWRTSAGDFRISLIWWRGGGGGGWPLCWWVELPSGCASGKRKAGAWVCGGGWRLAGGGGAGGS